MVKDLGVDPAAFAPRGDDDHGDAEAEAVGTGGVFGVALEDFVGDGDGGFALGAGLRWDGRGHVVEEAVVLVVHKEEGGLAPDFGVGGEDVEDLRDVPRAVVCGPVGMLGVGLGGDEPGDLREIAGAYVLLEDVEEGAGFEDVGSGASFFGEWRALRRVLVLVEVEERVVAVVADVGVVAGPSPGAAGVEAFADVLIDLPGDAGFLEEFGVGGPVVAGFGVVDDGAAIFAVVADPSGPHVVAIGVGGAEEGAVVGVADGEGVGEGVVEGNVAAGEVGHGGGALLRDPLIVVALVPGGVGGGPVMGEVLEELQA